MIERDIEIVNRLGLHARAAAKLVQLASGFESDIKINRQQDEVDGKSILGIMMLAAAQGTHVTVSCEGSDEEQAMKAVAQLFADKFGEGA
ncbi:MAG: HPr family phosphocarrier protein [Thermoanaerobaculia bacterium]|nr:HPr family phosphocarrier protein [Thermoanaerobaculia bacterium]